MFQRLQKKWKVGGTQLFLILCVFAITGTTTAYLTRQVTLWLDLNYTSAWYWALKIGMLVFGYQVLILLFAIPFGQFRFFWNYEKKILRWMGIMKGEQTGTGSQVQEKSFNKKNIIPVAVFASGAGSNAQQLINYFRDHSCIKIALIVCNKPGAGVLQIASRENIPTLLIEKEKFFRGNAYVDELREKQIHFIVLAGFLWKIPLPLLKAFPQRIINIHPALLPNYGGKGMYGSFVHEAVIAAKELQSGISIHLVDEIYDHGKVIFQATCTIDPGDTPAMLAKKIHALEHVHYPQVVEKVIAEQLS
jgi:formyltetrahydrofolate-dependent phosphoribosylglycinamide formyltransferase